MKRLISLALLLLLGCGSGSAEPPPMTPLPPPPKPPTLMVCLEWDAVIHPDLVGYRIHYGKVSEQYDFDSEVTRQYTEVCIMDNSYFIEGGTYFFVATAFSEDEESDYSNEVNWNP
jgi:hypothetical protein